MADPDWMPSAPQAASQPDWMPASAPAAAAPGRAPATGLGMIGQTWDDLVNSNHPQHDPNAVESALIGAAYNPVMQGAAKPVHAMIDSALASGHQVGQDLSDAGDLNNPGFVKHNLGLPRAAIDTALAVPSALIAPFADTAQRGLSTAYQATGMPQQQAESDSQEAISKATMGFASSRGVAGVAAAGEGAAGILDAMHQWDVTQNLKANNPGPVSSFVQGLFETRGSDTTPSANPSRVTQPTTGNQVAMNAADHMTLQQLMKTGDVDDIKNFFAGKQGPQPSWSSVNRFVEQRDNPNFEGEPRPVANPRSEGGQPFDYNSQYNDFAGQQADEKHRQAVEDHVNNIMSGWKNAPDVTVVHSPADIADPALRANVMRDDPDGTAMGIFREETGKTHIFSSNIYSPDEATSVLFHEGLGHFGLNQVFGDRLTQVMGNLADRNVGKFGDLVAKRQAANPGESKALSAEEVMATASQQGVMKPSWTTGIRTVVRQFARKMGMKTYDTDGEVNNILAMAHDAVVNGKSVRDNGFRTSNPTIQRLQALGSHGEIDGEKFMFTGGKAKAFNPRDPSLAKQSDGQWRTEISDHQAMIMNPEGNTLGEMLHHPELYKNYPQLRDLPVEHEGLDPKFAGMYNVAGEVPGKGAHMQINSELARSRPELMKAILLHESQHAIQDIEGYPEFKKIAATGGTQDMTREEYDNNVMEKEARATDSRMRMTPDQRSANPAKFMRTDALGRGLQAPEDLDQVDRLKQDPRYFSDREFRQNVNELARTRFAPEMGDQNKFATRAQINSSGIAKKDFVPEDLAGMATHIAMNYDKSVAETPIAITRQLAFQQGIEPNDIKLLAGRDPTELAARVARIGAAADYSSVKIKDILAKFDTPEWNAQSHFDLASAIADRNYLVERFKEETGQMGRALNVAKIFRSMTNGNIADVMERLKEEGSGLAGLSDPTNPNSVKFIKQLQAAFNGNPGKANNMMNNVNKPYWEQYLTTFHMNMMLSALSTHFKAPIDMGTGISRNIIEKAVAMPISQVRMALEKMTGKTVVPGVERAELANHLQGMMDAVTTGEVYRRSLTALKTGDSSYVLANKGAIGKSSPQVVPTNFANQFGAMSNPRMTGAFSLLNKPMDAVGAQDTFFRSVEMNAQLGTIGTREARGELGPNASSADVRNRGRHWAQNPTPSMLKEAFDETNRTLLLNDNPINRLVNRARLSSPGQNPGQRVMSFIANYLAPFIRVESNSLINRVIQRSPLGLVDPTGYTQVQLRAGGAKADIAISKMIYGTVLMGMMWAAGSKTKDYLTGEGDDNVDRYKEDLAAGRSPEAVHDLGRYSTGGQLGMSINPFDMHNKTAQMVAGMRQAWDAGANKGQVGTGFMLAMGSLFHDLAGASWVSDVTPAMDAITAHGETASQKVGSFISNEARTMIPNILNQTARTTDVSRDITADANGSQAERLFGGIGNDLASAVPGLREGLPIKYSVYGNPLPTGASWTGVHTLIPGLSGNGTSETTDPAERELDRLNVLLLDMKSVKGDTALPKSLVTPVSHSISVDGDKKTLTPSEFESYQQKAGRYIVEDVRNEMSTPAWQSMTDYERVQEVRNIESDQKANAKEELFGQ